MKHLTTFHPDRAVLTIRAAFVASPAEFADPPVEQVTVTLPDGQSVSGEVGGGGELAVYAAVLAGGCEGQHGPSCDRCETANRARHWFAAGRMRARGAMQGPAVPHVLRLEPLSTADAEEP